MGQRGPLPTPTPILKMRGSPRADRRAGEPKPPSKSPPTPRGLNSEERKIWRQTVARLKEVGTLAVTDGAAIERYCQAAVRRGQALATLRKLKNEVYTIINPKTKQIQYRGPHPEVAIVRQLGDEMRRFEIDFGLAPSGRAGLKIQVQKSIPSLPSRDRCQTA